MPGFSRDEQSQVALLVLAHRRSLKKVQARIEGAVDLRAVLALRLAVTFYRGRADIALPVHPGALRRRPLPRERRPAMARGQSALRPPRCAKKCAEWQRIGFELKVPELESAPAADASVLPV